MESASSNKCRRGSMLDSSETDMLGEKRGSEERPTIEKEAPMNARPLRDRVLVKRVEEQEQRIGGIIIPDTAKEKPQQAKVIAVGSGRVNEDGKTIPLDVKVGNHVLIGKYSGTEIKLDGEEYLIIREDEILGVAEGVPELATV
jgi:chaperonin GroES